MRSMDHGAIKLAAATAMARAGMDPAAILAALTDGGKHE